MSNAIISVENLGKKYQILHQGQRRGSIPLREAITLKAASLVRGLTRSNGRRPGGESDSASTREEFWALRDISFEVKEGEVLGIIGRNGAGKSTLLKILSRITEPTHGRIHIRGRVASLLEVGTGFHPELTGRENVFLNGAILGMSRVEIKRKFDEIVEFSGVEKFLDTPVKRYSSGMYVRLAFAVAAHLEPEILIVDEVLAVGDAEFQQKCLGRMKDVAGQGRTVLFVSHNMATVMKLTTRCVYLANGIVSFIGNTREAINEYMGASQDRNLNYLDMTAMKSDKPQICSVNLATALPGNVHFNGAPLEISLIVRAPRPIEGACLSVQFFDSDHINFVHLWTHDITLPMCRETGTYLIKCCIPSFRLYMGNYRLRVFFSGPPGGESFQTLEGICPFEVMMPNNSRLFQWWPKECTYIEDCRWEVRRINAE
jgi:lipopolysaccharide transport system ATP-binding protein